VVLQDLPEASAVDPVSVEEWVVVPVSVVA
jgi:hypothetical protein